MNSDNNYNLFNENLPQPLEETKLKEYLIKYKNGDLEAKDKIIKHNLLFVKYLVNKYFNNTSYDIDDLRSIGIIGLIKAIDTFDVNKNIKFSSYASKCIVNEILMFLRKNKKDLSNLSLEQTIGVNKDGEELLLGNIIADEKRNISLDYENKEELNYYKKMLYQALESLTPLEKEVITYYYFNKITQQQIATKMDCSRSNIERIIRNVLKKLRLIINNEYVLLSENKELRKRSSLNRNSLYIYFPNNSRDEVLNAVAKLDEKEKLIMELYYGLNGKEQQSVEYIARNTGYNVNYIKSNKIRLIKEKINTILNKSQLEDSKLTTKNIEQVFQDIEHQILNNTFDENKLSYKIDDETIYVDIIETKCSLAYKSNKTGLLDRIHAQRKNCLVYKIYLEKPNVNLKDKYIIKDKKTNKCYKYVYKFNDGNYDLTNVLNELVCFKIDNVKIETLSNLKDNYDVEKNEKFKNQIAARNQNEQEKQYKVFLSKSVELIKECKYLEAIEKLELCLKSNNPSTLFLANSYLGIIYLKQSKDLLALKYYQESLKYNAQDYYALLGMAKSFELLGDYKQAITYFQKCEQLSTSHVKHQLELGKCYKEMQEYPKALAEFDKIINKYNNNYNAYYEKAQLLLEIGNYNQAEENIKQALKYTNNQNEYALVLLGEIYYLTDNHEQAFQIFDDIVEKKSQNGLCEIGYFFHKLGLQDLAYKYYSKIFGFYKDMQKSKNEVESHIKEHTVYNQEKMHSIFNCPINLATLEALIKDCDKVAIAPRDDIYQFKCDNIGTLYIDENEKIEVNYLTIITLPFTKKIVLAYPDYKLRTDKKLAEINLDQITTIYENTLKEKVVDLQLDDKMTKDVNYAIKLFKNNEFNLAKPIFQKCLNSPNIETLGLVNYYLGRIYQNENKPLIAIQYFKNSLNNNKGYGSLLGLGKAYMSTKNYDEALNCFKECDNYNSTNTPHLIELGKCYKEMHNYDQALAIFNQLIENNNYNARYYKAILLYDLKRYDEALKEVEILLQLGPDNLFAKNLLGKIYYLTNKQDQALAIFEEIIKIDSKSKANLATQNIGYFFHELGLQDLAYQYYSKVRKFNKYFNLTKEEVNIHLKEHFHVPKNPIMHSLFNTEVNLELLEYLIKEEKRVAIKPMYDVYQIKCPNIGKLYITENDIQNEDYLTILTAPFTKKILLAYPDYRGYSQNLSTYTIDEIKKLALNISRIKVTNVESEDQVYEGTLVTSQENTISKVMDKLNISSELATYKNQLKLLINILPNSEEQVILLLSLGYVRNKYFTFEQISQFLNVTEKEVENTFNQALLNLNNIATFSLNGIENVKKLLIKKEQN